MEPEPKPWGSGNPDCSNSEATSKSVCQKEMTTGVFQSVSTNVSNITDIQHAIESCQVDSEANRLRTLSTRFSHIRYFVDANSSALATVTFAYLESLSRIRKRDKLDQEIARISSMNNLLEKLGGVSEDMVQDMAEPIISLLKSIRGSILDSGMTMDIVLQTFNNPQITNALISYLKPLTRIWLLNHFDDYKAFITPETTLEISNQNNLQATGVEDEALSILLMEDIFFVPNDFRINIISVNGPQTCQVIGSTVIPEASDGIGRDSEAIIDINIFSCHPKQYAILYANAPDRSADMLQVNRVATCLSLEYPETYFEPTPSSKWEFDFELLARMPGYSSFFISSPFQDKESSSQVPYTTSLLGCGQHSDSLTVFPSTISMSKGDSSGAYAADTTVCSLNTQSFTDSPQNFGLSMRTPVNIKRDTINLEGLSKSAILSVIEEETEYTENSGNEYDDDLISNFTCSVIGLNGDEIGSEEDLGTSFEALQACSKSPRIFLRAAMATSKQDLIDTIMEEFWVIFNHESTTETHMCAGNDSPASSSVIEHQSLTPTQSTSRKRSRNKRDDSPDDDENENERNKGHEKISTLQYGPRTKFACPYRKYDPGKFNVNDARWRSCALTPLESIARVKGHLYRHHRVFQCRRCNELFKDQDELIAHGMAAIACELKDSLPAEGITDDIERRLRSRKKTHLKQSEVDRWSEIYKLLFPTADIPNPYFEPLQEGMAQQFSSQELNDFEEYSRRELPRVFRTALEEVVDRSLRPIEEDIRSDLTNMIQVCQDRVFSMYRQLVPSNTSTGEAAISAVGTMSRCPSNSLFEAPKPNLQDEERHNSKDLENEPLPEIQPDLVSLPSNFDMDFDCLEKDLAYDFCSLKDTSTKSMPVLNTGIHFDGPTDTAEDSTWETLLKLNHDSSEWHLERIGSDLF